MRGQISKLYLISDFADAPIYYATLSAAVLFKNALYVQNKILLLIKITTTTAITELYFFIL